MEPMTQLPPATGHSASERLHGEYKVPGGKLVVADLAVVSGVLKDVSISGDFFLEPDEALLDINRALTGLPEHTPAADLAAAVTTALPAEAVLFGFSADAVAITVRPSPRPPPGPTTSGTSSDPRSCPPKSTSPWTRSSPRKWVPAAGTPPSVSGTGRNPLS
jgi:hypothetical protein